MIWHLRAYQLKLPDVPADRRADIRNFLAPILRKRVPIEMNQCWGIALDILMKTDSDRCRYVEGVWLQSDWTNLMYVPITPHAWVTVDGYRVDLLEESFRLINDTEYLYEPVKEFSVADIQQFGRDYPNAKLGRGSLLTYPLYAAGLPDGMTPHEFETKIEWEIFRDALKRLVERQKTSDPRAALKFVTR
jgi:hypothetical protein